ncbi:MAG: hypothetical protein CL799_11950 [Chromatiales bacterium]|nr:hypothetical protein [Chromatiales bacterium]
MADSVVTVFKEVAVVQLLRTCTRIQTIWLRLQSDLEVAGRALLLEIDKVLEIIEAGIVVTAEMLVELHEFRIAATGSGNKFAYRIITVADNYPGAGLETLDNGIYISFTDVAKIALFDE